MSSSREKGVVLMNKIARMVGASVSMSHKRPTTDLFIKSSYAFINDGENVDEECWDTHMQKGMKKKGNKMVPNCVPKEDKDADKKIKKEKK
jgi:hypothetical protein